MRKYIIIILLIVLANCQAMLDSPLDIGLNYVYFNQSVYQTDSTASQYTIPMQLIIPPEIVSINWNDRFIVAVQIPDSSYFITDTAYMNKEYKDSAQIAFNKQLKFGRSFWIVDKYENNVLGAMDSLNYMRLCDSLSIDIGL